MRTVTTFSLFLAAKLIAHGQGFINLDFEATTVPASQPPSVYIYPSTWVSTSSALPGWSAALGTNDLNSVLYNSLTIGSAGVSLLRTGNGLIPPIEGTFSAVLLAGLLETPPGSLTPFDASLSQTGLVSGDAQSLRFRAYKWSRRPFAVTLDGRSLDLVSLEDTTSYVVYGADVQAFAGQVAELRITAFTPDGGLNLLMLDSIFFSPIPIPEPGGAALLIAGLFLLGLWKHDSRR